MLPMKDVRLQIGELLAADDTTLAPAVGANKIALFKNNAAVDENLVAGDLELADFDGSTAISGATGTQQAGVDPTTLDQVVTIKPPAGGYRWETSGVTNLPQTIYGFALLDSTLATLLGAQLFDEPITLTEEGQEIALPPVNMTVVAQPIS